ncbi:MAG TPA: hypothetical protein VH280_13995 [Verrucomicrobiae bacterium]|nr:hypothetical protein [Verrucomicrobiae bacterium]
MKRTIVILAVAAASMVAFAQPPPNNPAPARTPAATPAAPTQKPPVAKKESAQVPKSGFSTPLKYFTKPLIKRKVESVDGMSSRPWVQIVGIRPGYSAFPPPEMHESTLYLFWVGRDPH